MHSNNSNPSINLNSICKQPMLQLNSSTPQLLITKNNVNSLISSSFQSILRKMKSGDSSITINEPKTDSKGNAAPAATTKATALRAKGGWKRGLAIFDFILRLNAIGAAVAAAATMGTTDQTLPFFTQFFQFHASYDDLPAFMFFVIANAIASGYLVLSLPFSIIGIVRPQIAGARLLLLICDTVMVSFISAAAAAAASIVYLVHNGNSTANWVAICQQFDSFCQQISGAVVSSFLAALVLMLLVVTSALAIRKHS